METLKKFEDVIKNRHSTRRFASEKPTQEVIMKIAESAIYAPIGGVTNESLDERLKLFIVLQGTAQLDKIRGMIAKNCRKGARVFGILTKILPFTKNKFGGFAANLKMISQNGIPSLTEAPYLIILAEKKGFPPVAKQSAAHALENMWLTATQLDLGFQIITAFSQLSDNKEFMDILGLKVGAYEIECCAVGFPKTPYNEEKNYDAEKFVKWIK